MYLPFAPGKPQQQDQGLSMNRQEIEQSFVSAGWDLDGSFGEHLIIGYSADSTSLLTHKEVWGAEDPLFEILDHERMVSNWVREIPAPQKARELLQEHGESSEMWEEQPS